MIQTTPRDSCRPLGVCAVVLAGCAGERLNKGLSSMMGQDVRVFVAKWGYPSGKREILGDTIYTWGNASSGVVPIPQTTTTTGFAGNVPVMAITTSTSYMPVTYQCTIEVAVDQNDRMKSYQFRGNQGGCAPYANRL
jgi:hypothetical protein